MKKLTLILAVLWCNAFTAQEAFNVPLTKGDNAMKITAAPANDNCTNATSLTIGAALTCNQTTDQAGIQSGECVYPAGGGMSEQTVWYRITATNDSLVLNLLKTNTSTFVHYITVYGPFASGAGCLPACTNTVYTAVQNGDPGSHILLTGLATSGNRDYLIQVQGFSGGGAGDPFINFCINVANPASNVNANVAAVINQCGTTYNGTTNGGYWPTGTSTGFNNLDNNNSTTVSGASQTGDDVTFVINNISWFKFCSINAGTYNVQFDVITCAFSGVNSGGQMAILTGTNNNLTNIWQAANPTYTNTAIQTSPNFTLAAGGCAYLVVDGFAGDACSYSYVLTNVSGGCTLLPIELISFIGYNEGVTNIIKWNTATESNNKGFHLYRSIEGINWKEISFIDGAGSSQYMHNYTFLDVKFEKGINYYLLEQEDYDGRTTRFDVIAIDNSKFEKAVVKITNLLGQEVTEDYKGVRFLYYKSGEVIKDTTNLNQ